ncbi:MAG TPA: carboxypeptidase-like regulatory domain-containing protein [Vicinamibacterales bacterium]
MCGQREDTLGTNRPERRRGKGDRYPARRGADDQPDGAPHPVLAGATVTVAGGEASGISSATREDGSFEIAAAGTFKLRFEHPGFIASESSDTVMIAGGLTLPEVTLATAPWSISGVITDSLGHPVPDADVTVLAAEFHPFATVRTNAGGNYTLSSTLPHFASVLVTALKAGFQPLQTLAAVPCCGTAPVIKLVRIVSITPTAPNALRAGESVEMPASHIVFDTGERRDIFVLPSSNPTSVVAINRSSYWYAMQGVSPGDATLTFDLWGAVASVQVHVRP